MNNEIYFAIGILSAMVYFICFAFIIVLIRGRKASSKTAKNGLEKNETNQNAASLGKLRMKMDNIQEDFEAAQKQMWQYGVEEEEKGRRWRLACLAVAGKSVTALQSCWLQSETDKTAKDIYDEMLSSLKTVGVMEIRPKEGDPWEQMDLRYRVRNKKGGKPYRICKLVYPGYKFVPSLSNAPDMTEEMILEPAYIDVLGETEN
jgi:hypothetical protein